MPLVNYARDALICHCLEVSGENGATDTLDKVVRNNLDFLVGFAIIPVGQEQLSINRKHFLSRFRAEKWIKSYLKRHRNQTYSRSLARAYLLTPQLSLPESIWNSPNFVADFEEEVRLVYEQRRPPRFNNFPLVRSNPYSGPIIKRLEDRIPREVIKYENLYRSLVIDINAGLPPSVIICRFFGSEKQRVYEDMLESIESMGVDSELDVDGALSLGESRQRRGHGLWSHESCQRAMDRLSIYITGKRRGDLEMVIGEEYEIYKNQKTVYRNSKCAEQIEMAKSLNIWRIRKGQSDQWKQALTKSEWACYLRCDRALRSSLPSGVISRITRRHFNQNSLNEMKTKNLYSMCLCLNVNEPLFAAPEED